MAFMCEVRQTLTSVYTFPQSELGAIELMFSVFANDENGILQTDFLLMLIGFLLAHDTKRPREFMDQLSAEVKSIKSVRLWRAVSACFLMRSQM